MVCLDLGDDVTAPGKKFAPVKQALEGHAMEWTREVAAAEVTSVHPEGVGPAAAAAAAAGGGGGVRAAPASASAGVGLGNFSTNKRL